MTRDEIVERYRQAAIRHGRASDEGRARVANKATDELIRMLELLCADDPEGARALLPLLEDDDPSVRCWAGRDTIELAPERVLPVLRALAIDAPGMVRHSADMMSRQWKTYGRVGPDVPMPPLDDDLPPA